MGGFQQHCSIKFAIFARDDVKLLTNWKKVQFETQKVLKAAERKIMQAEYFCIGVITEPHGIKGEVKVYPTTDDPDRIAELDEIILRGGGKDRVVHPASVRWQKDRLIIKFKEINDRNETETLRKYELYVTRENAVELDENEYYVQDLIGLDVYNEGNEHIGKLDDVIRTGANDVYQILKNDGRELLLPAISECIIEVDIENGRMTVHVMEGLE